MGNMLGKLVSFRMSEDMHMSYLQAAADLGISLSEFLRLKLESIGDEAVADQIAQLRLTLIDTKDPAESTAESYPILLETLLLLRKVCTPGDVRSIQNELRRIGYSPWSPETTRIT